MMQRRQWLRGSAATAVLGVLGGCATPSTRAAKVVVVGGGYGGTTAAKHLRLWSDHALDVTLIEPEDAFVSCPLSNLVVGGLRSLDSLRTPYTALASRHGVRVVRDRVTALDTAARRVRLAGGASLPYDKLVLSPGVELMTDRVAGLPAAQADQRALHAWKAGAETVALWQQLEAMRDGGVYAITVPEAPYRCPPGPYERASVVAAYFKRAKPRSKVLILDANPEVTSKAALFRKAWSELYPGMVEFRGQHALQEVVAGSRTLRFELHDEVRADVLNVLPPMRAGGLAVQTGLADANGRWCSVDFKTFESRLAPHVHVIGDAIQVASLMPKSGHMANAHAKVAAAAIVAQLAGWEVPSAPVLTNTCYSFVAEDSAIHVASVHAYDAVAQTFTPVAGAGGVSAERSALEARHALGWARNIWNDALG